MRDEILAPAQEYLGLLTRKLIEMEEWVRRDIDRITGISDLGDLRLRGEREARWGRFKLESEAIQKQRDAIIKVMTTYLAAQPPTPLLITVALPDDKKTL